MESWRNHVDQRPSPFLTERLDDNTTWVLLSSRHQHFPAKELQVLKQANWKRELETLKGELPVPFNYARSWWPWRPILSEAKNTWYLNPGLPINSRTCADDLDLVNNVVRSIRYAYKGLVPPHDGPKEIAPPRTWSPPIAELAREAMVEGIAYILWWMSFCLDTEAKLKQNVIRMIDGLNVGDFSKAGVVIDLEQDCQVLNLPLWREHDVPVYYLWRPQFENVTRFLRLDPRVLALLRAGQTPHQIEKRISPGIFQFDKYLQDCSNPPPRIQPAPTKKRSDYIIDFEGWGARSIEKSLSKKYSGRLVHWEYSTPQAIIRVYYRWRNRPVTAATAGDDDDDDDVGVKINMGISHLQTDDNKESPDYLREVYRIRYGPTAERKFDKDTGNKINVATSSTIPKSYQRLPMLPSADQHPLATAPSRYPGPHASDSNARGTRGESKQKEQSPSECRPTRESQHSMERVDSRSYKPTPRSQVPGSSQHIVQHPPSLPTSTNRSPASTSVGEWGKGGWGSGSSNWPGPVTAGMTGSAWGVSGWPVPVDSNTAAGLWGTGEWPKSNAADGGWGMGGWAEHANSNAGGGGWSEGGWPESSNSSGGLGTGGWPVPVQSDTAGGGSCTRELPASANPNPAEGSWRGASSSSAHPKSRKVAHLSREANDGCHSLKSTEPPPTPLAQTGPPTFDVLNGGDCDVDMTTLSDSGVVSLGEDSAIEEDTEVLGPATTTVKSSSNAARDRLIHLIQSRVGVHAAIDPIVHIPSNQWNSIYLERGRLILEPAAEVRLRYLALKRPECSWSDILSWALSRCISFQLVVRSSDLELFRPQIVTQAMLDNAVHFHSDSQQPLQHLPDIRKYIQRWRASCSDILKRDHARAFLFCGGIVSRLALMLGGEELVRRAISGPSCQLTVNELGHTTHLDNHNYRSDRVSDAEIAILLGQTDVDTKVNGTVQRFLFPPQSVFDRKIPAYAGQWSQPCEDLFQSLWGQVSDPKSANPMLLTAAEWVKYIRPVTNVGQALRFEDEPLPQIWAGIAQELAVTMGGKLHGVVLQQSPGTLAN